MGTNKRYADKIDAQMNQRISELAIRPSPITLTPEQLDVEHNPVKQAESGVPVRAWVRYPETVVRAEGRAIAWTSRAVLVRWTSADGAEREAWVWASAVDRV